ncbi:MAG: hypothetical protein IKQ92_13600 [Clostridia bacterium]|nr:hypothetical protein [Clostridia bacterium]
MAEKKNTAAEEAAKKALEAAQAKKAAGKVQHTYTQVGQQSASKEELLAVTRKNALPYRIAAIILWVLAICFEIFAILLFVHKIEFGFTVENPGWTISWIVCIVLDLVCVIIGSNLWKKSNHLDPASAKSPFRFWLHNNLGVVMAILAFVPFIIVVLTDKNSNKQSKTIAVIVAVVALLIGGLTSYDYNPISQEELLENADIDTVYWTASGTVFHAYDDCSHLSNTVELLTGTSASAIENGKTRLCKTCEARAMKEGGEAVSSGAEKAEEAVEDTLVENAAEAAAEDAAA